MNPKLTNRRTGVVIEVNTYPFSIGRGLSCNYIIPSKTVSRVHCILRKESNSNNWTLDDTSTNGTLINGQLLKGIKNAPLKTGDVISLEMDGPDTFVFSTGFSDDGITDDELSAITDRLLGEMEQVAAQQTSRPGEPSGSTVASHRRPASSSSPPVNPLLDHVYSSSCEATKKARLGRSPRGSRRSSTAAQESVPVALKSEPAGSEGSEGAFVVASSVDETSACQKSGGDSGDGIEKEVITSAVAGAACTSNAGELAETETGHKAKSGNDRKGTEQDYYEEMENELQCVICSELFIKPLTLNCSHSFCKYCIGLWSKNKSDCPICRTKIVSSTSSIVLDNIIEKVIQNSSDEVKKHRLELLEERRKLEEEETAQASGSQQAGPRGRGRQRGRPRGTRTTRAGAARGRQQHEEGVPRISVLDPLTINIGTLANNVIEVSSDSDWSTDTESPSDLQEEYDNDDWYPTRRSYWGGYGHCFRCGSPNHWANACPNR